MKKVNIDTLDDYVETLEAPTALFCDQNIDLDNTTDLEVILNDE